MTAAVAGKVQHRPTVFTVNRPGIRAPFFLRLPSTDIGVYRQIFVDREYDFDVAATPRVIVDAGAHIGLASICFANRFPESTILAIEPEGGNFRLLERNVAPYAGVIPIQAALWKETAKLELVDPGLGSWGFMTRCGLGVTDVAGIVRHKVRAVTIDDLLGNYDLECIDLLKLDIEGAEREVLDHSAPWIARVGAIVVELHERLKPGCERSFSAATAAFPHRWCSGENVCVARAGSCLLPPMH